MPTGKYCLSLEVVVSFFFRFSLIACTTTSQTGPHKLVMWSAVSRKIQSWRSLPVTWNKFITTSFALFALTIDVNLQEQLQNTHPLLYE